MLVKMPIHLFLILIILPTLGLAQKITYELRERNPCTGMVTSAGIYYISKGEMKYFSQDSTMIINLSDTGNYVVHFEPEYSSPADSMNLALMEYKEYSDTLTGWKIRECLEPVSHPSFIGFCCCNWDKCEGEQIDYYSNGQIRIEGAFKNGNAIGKLTYYYPSGRIEEVRYYDKKGKGIMNRKILYNENGQQIKK